MVLMRLGPVNNTKTNDSYEAYYEGPTDTILLKPVRSTSAVVKDAQLFVDNIKENPAWEPANEVVHERILIIERDNVNPPQCHECGIWVTPTEQRRNEMSGKATALMCMRHLNALYDMHEYRPWEDRGEYEKTVPPEEKW